MAIVSEITQYVILAICLFVSPIDETMGVYLDSIEDGSSVNIEALYVMHDSAGPELHCYTGGGSDPIFSVERKGDKYVFFSKDSEEKIEVDLNRYLSSKDKTKLKEEAAGGFSIPLKKSGGDLKVMKSGSVIYLSFEEVSGVLFSVHE